MGNEIGSYVIGAVTFAILVLTFIFSTNDRRRNFAFSERDEAVKERNEAIKERDAWKQRAEIAERRADDYADRYFRLRDQRDQQDKR